MEREDIQIAAMPHRKVSCGLTQIPIDKYKKIFSQNINSLPKNEFVSKKIQLVILFFKQKISFQLTPSSLTTEEVSKLQWSSD